MVAVPQLSDAVGLAGAGTALKHWAVVSAGTPLNTGAVVSCTVIVWLALALFPQSSVAVHVRVIIVGQVPDELSLNETEALPHESDAVTVAAAGTEPHSTVVSAGTPLSVGAVVSTTVMTWSPLVLLPQSSVAVQVRVMVFVLPQAATSLSLDVIVTLPQASLPVALPVAAGLVSPVHSTVASAGTVKLGAVVSTTVITWSPLVLLPQSSVAVHVRVIVFVLPQAATSLSLDVIVTLPQASLPVALPVEAGLVSSVHSTVASAGTLRLGAVVSTTVMT
jgi:hypothetical protein